jgi:hypothetical protein
VIRFVLLLIALFKPFWILAADCATCHPAEAKLHSQSAHASALMPPVGSPFATHLPNKPLGEAADGYSFVYRRTLDGMEVTAQRGSDNATAPLVWIFGSGRQGQTPVLSFHGTFIEHRVSYYDSSGYGITIGQENGISANAKKALGWAQSLTDARKCFHCHSTSASDDLTSLTPGVQCIRCHRGAEDHAEGHGLPVNPGKLEHVAQVQLCGECHRLKPPSGDDENIGNVRFQPLRMMKSACYRNSEIKCTTCHPAHRNAQRDVPDVYNAKCLDCHPSQRAHITAEKSDNCIACHMPKVNPAPALTFTDHFIRIVATR